MIQNPVTARLLELIRAYPDGYRGKGLVVEFLFDTTLQPALKRKRRELWGLENKEFSTALLSLGDGPLWSVVFEMAIGERLVNERPVTVQADVVVLVDLVDPPESEQKQIGLRVTRIETRKLPNSWWNRLGRLLKKIPITH